MTEAKEKTGYPAARGLDRAVDMTRNPQYRLEGPCPSCGEMVTVSVDTLYDRMTGVCPSCKQALAYRAPDGTYRTDVIDPAPGVWRVDIRHYCADCRYEVPFCRCPVPVEVPENYAEKSRHPWEPARDLSGARSAAPTTAWELERAEDSRHGTPRYQLTVRVQPAWPGAPPYIWTGRLSLTPWGRCSLEEMTLEFNPARRGPPI